LTTKDDANRVLVRDLKAHIGSNVNLLGRVTAKRDHGGIGFIDLQDRTGKVQLVVDDVKELPPFQGILHCQGVVIENDRALGAVEIHVKEIDVLAAPTIELAFDPETVPPPCDGGGPSMKTILDNRELSLRSTHNQAIVRINSELLAAVDSFLRGEEFFEIKTPKIVAGGTEGGAGLFEIRYFERVAHLAQSPQLFKQTLASTPIERVFEIGPAFRSEKHETGRHLNEFTSIDIEMAYPTDLTDIMDLFEDLIRAVVQHLSAACKEDIALLKAKMPKLDRRLPRIDFDTAKEIATGKRPSRARPAEHLSPEDELVVCDWALKEHGTEAVFVHSFPRWIRPFYTKPSGNPKKTESFDFLLRGLELSSGGLRIYDAQEIETSLKKKGLDPLQLSSYLRVFRGGCPPHGGFGIGLERFVQKLLALPNVRYASLFPRDRSRIEP